MCCSEPDVSDISILKAENLVSLNTHKIIQFPGSASDLAIEDQFHPFWYFRNSLIMHIFQYIDRNIDSSGNHPIGNKSLVPNVNKYI